MAVLIRIEKKGSNVLLSFNNAASLLVDYDTVINNGFRINDEVSDEQFKQLENRSEFIKIKDLAFLFLNRRIHSKSELRLKLYKKEYNHEIIEKVLSELEVKKYLDDKQFAIKFAEEKLYSKRYGINKIRASLFSKGIERETVEEVIKIFENDEVNLTNAYFLIKKKLKYYETKNLTKNQIRQKIYSFLLSRGFKSDIIKMSLDKNKI